ncbi:TlpA family protein disulfide reductase [Geothrix oryzisoli]|uniref:TlpA family protein disulfide reductase n=1 Tax=Geothrix oryzisoli TaxID=2922721 RepID=UPI001FAE311B|nr:TlpA disulfide reductase family protein [Geothrix oryzisoli]
MSRLESSLLCLLSGLALGAQGVFGNANSPSDPTCPRIMQEKTELNYKSQYGRNGADASAVRYSQWGNQYFPPAERKDVSSFAAYDEKGRGTSVASLKGKVVLVGLWSTRCDPSAKMLMEFASLYAKRVQYGFEILSVNFDENQQGGEVAPNVDVAIEGGWRAINKFRLRNRQFFDASKMPVYTPGLGKEGPSTFMDMVYSVPVLFVVDRQGKLAELHIGYQDGFVGQALMRALRERTAPPVPAPAPATEPAQH